MSREKKVLFVTGASSDVGQALILQIADQYDTIVAHYCHSHEHINLVVEIENQFGMKFTMGEVHEMKNVGEMVDIIIERATK